MKGGGIAGQRVGFTRPDVGLHSPGDIDIPNGYLISLLPLPPVSAIKDALHNDGNGACQALALAHVLVHGLFPGGS